VRYLKEDRVFIGTKDGSLYEYCRSEKRVVRFYGKVFNRNVRSMEITGNNKSLYVCDLGDGIAEFDIRTNKRINSFPNINVCLCVVTFDSKFLFTAEYSRNNPKLSKWSIETNQRVHSWSSNLDQYVTS